MAKNGSGEAKKAAKRQGNGKDKFGKALRKRQEAVGHALPFQPALEEVAEAAETCRLWFKAKGLKASGGDVIEMAKLVLERSPAKKRFTKDGVTVLDPREATASGG